ncbi:hypothetical protein [Neisseria sp. Ec49-e6-T10]|uniref:hypothetical protein n=1 Tax=Neisseria sp. Ec49-e6-T10 TaxID=3140744 RepID=UPI003EC06575
MAIDLNLSEFREEIIEAHAVVACTGNLGPLKPLPLNLFTGLVCVNALFEIEHTLTDEQKEIVKKVFGWEIKMQGSRPAS